MPEACAGTRTKRLFIFSYSSITVNIVILELSRPSQCLRAPYSSFFNSSLVGHPYPSRKKLSGRSPSRPNINKFYNPSTIALERINATHRPRVMCNKAYYSGTRTNPLNRFLPCHLSINGIPTVAHPGFCLGEDLVPPHEDLLGH